MNFRFHRVHYSALMGKFIHVQIKVNYCTLLKTAREMEMAFDEESLSESNLKLVIYDDMALVNKLEIGKDVKTCKELKHYLLID